MIELNLHGHPSFEFSFLRGHFHIDLKVPLIVLLHGLGSNPHQIIRDDGRKFTLLIDSLSEKDQKFLKDWSANSLRD